MGRSNKEKEEEARRQNSKNEGNKMSSRVVEELNASGFVTAGAYNAVLQKVVMETEGKEMRRQASSRSALSASTSSSLSLSFFSASKRGSINFLEDDDSAGGDDCGEDRKSSRSLMDKLNASFSSFYTNSMRSLGDELGESPAEKCHIKKVRNIAPKRTSIEHKRAINI